MHLLTYANKKRLCTWYFWGYVVVQLLEALRYKSESHGQFPMVSLEFFGDVILMATLWPWG